MSLPKFEYITAQSVEEASRLARELGTACRFIAGGTDVIPLMKDRVEIPKYIIDLKRISGMDHVSYRPGEGLTIGALTNLRSIETSPIIREKLGAVADAAHYVASTQIRYKGTMAGNICNASPCADTAPILMVLNASVKTFRITPDNGRVIPLSTFFKDVKKTHLEHGEIVTEIEIPDLMPGEGAAYFKHAVRKAMDIGIVGVAAWVKMDGTTCLNCRIALGGVATTPMRARDAEKMVIGKAITPELLEDVGVAASEECRPISDVRASAEYRKDMIRVFTKRSIKKAIENLRA